MNLEETRQKARKLEESLPQLEQRTTLDKADEYLSLLDELNEARKNIDTLEDKICTLTESIIERLLLVKPAEEFTIDPKYADHTYVLKLKLREGAPPHSTKSEDFELDY